jgi:RIP metalloprotease RseP
VILAAGVPDRSSTRVTTVAGSPAALAGVRDGDEIVSIAGEKVNRFTDVREILARVPNGQTEITVRRDGALLTANATPSRVEGRNVLGVQWAPSTSMPSPGHLFSATATATKELVIATANGIAGIAGAVASIPANLVSTRDDTAQGARLLSPIGAARVASDAAEESGWYAPLLLLAGSSMFVGAFNLLPIPPLDGGHILIAAYEAIASRIKRRNVEVSSEALAPFVRLVVSFIVVLGLSTILLDIIRPV